FATTSIFLERLGLDSLADLPSLAEFIPDAAIVETLERGLRLPSERDLAADLEDDESSDDAPVMAAIETDHVDLLALEAAEAVEAVDDVAAELQAGLDEHD